ncbi:hypothetical protein BGX38DRAFT_1262945 [Terfezia claveryi]|nr:hypothetical protein BGX38DRAFT_1262945 [Terfezia claveryi]
MGADKPSLSTQPGDGHCFCKQTTPNQFYHSFDLASMQDPTEKRPVQRSPSRDALKLKRVMDVIEEEFTPSGWGPLGAWQAFLRSWWSNEQTANLKAGFVHGEGAREIMEMWLDDMEDLPQGLVRFVGEKSQNQVKELLKDQNSVLRNARNTPIYRDPVTSQLVPSLEEMETLVKIKAPIVWQLMEYIAIDKKQKAKGRSGKMIFTAIMILLYARNQQVNTFQTMMGTFLDACQLTKFGFETMHGTGFCCSHIGLGTRRLETFGYRAQANTIIIIFELAS